MSVKKPKQNSSLERRELEQLSLTFPGLLELLENKTMDNLIYPHEKKGAALAVAKGMHVVDAGRRQA
jgi:hypothetical protein